MKPRDKEQKTSAHELAIYSTYLALVGSKQ